MQRPHVSRLLVLLLLTAVVVASLNGGWSWDEVIPAGLS